MREQRTYGKGKKPRENDEKENETRERRKHKKRNITKGGIGEEEKILRKERGEKRKKEKQDITVKY